MTEKLSKQAKRTKGFYIGLLIYLLLASGLLFISVNAGGDWPFSIGVIAFFWLNIAHDSLRHRSIYFQFALLFILMILQGKWLADSFIEFDIEMYYLGFALVISFLLLQGLLQFIFKQFFFHQPTLIGRFDPDAKAKDRIYSILLLLGTFLLTILYATNSDL